jgi:hypothetical protein
MKKLTIGLLVLLCAALYTSSVVAWDDLIRLQDGAITAEKGTGEGVVGIRYSSANDMFDKVGERKSLSESGTEFRIVLMADYVVSNKRDDRFLGHGSTKIFAILPVVSQSNNLTPDGENNSGIGDIWLGVKYPLFWELLTVRGALGIPTGDDEKGLGNAGGFGIDVAALTTIRRDKLQYDVGIGIRDNNEDGDTKLEPSLGFYFNGQASYAVTAKIPAYINLTYMRRDDSMLDFIISKNSSVKWLDMAVGTRYPFTKAINVNIELGYKFMGTNTPADFGILVGSGFRYSK